MNSEIYCIIALLVVPFFAVMLLRMLHKPKARAKIAAGILDQVLLWWAPRDCYKIRSLLDGGCIVLGRAGGGKTTSSGRTLGQAIVDHPRSGGLVLLPKPEDVEMWVNIFRKAKRLQDLIVFDPQAPFRFNFLDYVGKGQTRAERFREQFMTPEWSERWQTNGGPVSSGS